MDQTEALAKALLEAVMPECCLVYYRDQSRAIHDFDLYNPDGRRAAVEVTASADEEGECTIAAITDQRKGGRWIKTNRCNKDWYIHPCRGARINQLRENADAYLAVIEAEGIATFFGPKDSLQYTSVQRIYTELFVLSGRVMEWKTPGFIGIAPLGGGGAFGVSTIQEAITKEAQKADNRAKLAASGVAERHLFVYVHPRNYLPWIALVELGLSGVVPGLPPEVTHVWAASEARNPNEYIVWMGTARSCWVNAGPIIL